MLKFFRSLIVLLGSIFICCCASVPEQEKSPPSPISKVLEEVNENSPTTEAPDSKTNPLLSNISETLKGLGYEALGLSFESDETLLLLGKVFDSPLTHDRKIRIIYTGLQMDYDAKHQSLTINGEKDLATILSFIDKNVPKQIPDPPPASSIQPNSNDRLGIKDKVVPPTKPLKKGLSKGKVKSKNFEKKQRSSKSKTRKIIPVSSSSTSSSTTVTSTTLAPAAAEVKPTTSTTLPPSSQVPDASLPQESPSTDDTPAAGIVPKQKAVPNTEPPMEEQQEKESSPSMPEKSEIQQNSREE
jgi:hypothetical protein